MGDKDIVITYISYKASIENGVTALPVSIYMANSDKESFANENDWLELTNFQPVLTNYELPLRTSGIHDIRIPLQFPFLYTGNNLVIMTHKETTTVNTSNGNGFWQTPATGSFVSLSRATDGGNFSPASPPSTSASLLDYKPQMRFGFTEGFGILTGTVKGNIEGDVETLEGVTVTQGGVSTTSGADGEYEILINTNSITPIVFNCYSFINHTVLPSEISWTGDVLKTGEYDTTMLQADMYTVKGKVIFGDTNEPAGGVIVNIGTRSGITGEDGEFEIEYVYVDGDQRVYIVAPAGYEDFTDIIIIHSHEANDEGIITLGNIVLDEAIRPPLYVHAYIKENGHRQVNWFHPNSGTATVSWVAPTETFDNVGSGDFIAATYWSAATIRERGLAGTYLAMLSFMPASTASQELEIVVWVGDDMSDVATVSATPDYEQALTESALVDRYNEYILDTPILLTGTQDVLIGVRSADISLVAFYENSGAIPPPILNRIYINGAWTVLATQGNNRFNWAMKMGLVVPAGVTIIPTPEPVMPSISIVGTAFMPSAQNPTRAFRDKYNVYRENQLLTDPAHTEADVFITFEDATSAPQGSYRYSVAAIFESASYGPDPTHQYKESERIESNTLGSPPTIPLVVNVTTDDGNPITGAVVSATPGGLLGTLLSEDGETTASFRLDVLPDIEYTVAVSLDGYTAHKQTAMLSTYEEIDVTLSASTLLFFSDFSDEPENWTNLDDNDDDYLWRFNGAGYNDTTAAFSESLCMNLGVCVYPDNWLITPAITLPPDTDSMYLTYWVAPNSSVKPQERLFTYITTTIASATPARTDFLTTKSLNNPVDGWVDEVLADGVEMLTSTIFSAGHKGWVLQKEDLRLYEGRTVYIAFRHAHSKDQDRILLSDIQITYVPTPPAPPTYTVSGTIKYGADNPVPIPEALLLLTNTGVSGLPSYDILSGLQGEFTFPSVELGQYVLSTSGYFNTHQYNYVSEPMMIEDDNTSLSIVITSNTEGDAVVSPVSTALRSNYPNPFNPTTTISFDMARSGRVCVEVFNIRGQRARVLVDGEYGAGSHTVVWNGDDFSGRSVGSGVYFYRMTTAGYSSVRKMLLMK